MDDELHSTSFSKKTFGDNRLLSGHLAECRASCHYIFDNLLSPGIVNRTFRLEPGNGFLYRGMFSQLQAWLNMLSAIADNGTQFTDVIGKLFGSRRSFTHPKRDGWRRAVRVFD